MSKDYKKFEFGGLVISRMPEHVKQQFKTLARDEFCDDYGMALVFLFNEAMEYKQLKKKLLHESNSIKLIIDKKEGSE